MNFSNKDVKLPEVILIPPQMKGSAILHWAARIKEYPRPQLLLQLPFLLAQAHNRDLRYKSLQTIILLKQLGR